MGEEAVRLLVRAPMMGSAEEVVEYLTARGCHQITVHDGPDGSYRGCGMILVGKERDES